MALRRIRAVVRKEWKVLRRDRFYLLIAIIMPMVTMILMGYGITYDVKNLRLGVLDLDRSTESLQFVDAFSASGYFRLAVQALRPDDLDQAMVAGRIGVAVVIPPGFSRALHRGRPAEAQILLDGSLPTRAEIARGYVGAIVAQFNRGRLDALSLRLPAGASEVGPSIDVISRVWFNPTLESKNFLVPGLLMLSLLFWAPALVSLSVTREKESGAILNVQTVPLARWEYVAGKLIPYTGITFAAYWLLVLATVTLFRIPVKGSLVVLSLGALLYVTAITAVGLLISMLVRTQVAALLTSTVLVFAVGLFYSGWMEPVSTLEPSGRLLSRALPTAYFGELSRGVILKGLGVQAYGRTLLLLALYVSVYVSLAILAFRKRRR